MSSDQINDLCRQISERIEEIFEFFSITTKEIYGNYSSSCPVHGGDSTTAFNFYPNTNTEKRPMWICCTRKCEETFFKSSLGLIRGIISNKKYGWQKKGDKEAGMWEAINFLKKQFNIFIDENKKKTQEENRSFIKKANFFQEQEQVTGTIVRSQAQKMLDIPSNYFLEQGFEESTLKFFDVGDCFYGDMQDRATAPIFDENNKTVIGFTGRALGPNSIKWKNTKGFPKGRCLYNQFHAFNYGKKINSLFIVEGPKDVWRMHEAGYPNTVAVFGVNLTDGQQILLEKSGIMNIKVFFDMDEAGENGYNSIKESLKRSFNVSKVNNTHKGKDPADFSVDELQELLGDQ